MHCKRCCMMYKSKNLKKWNYVSAFGKGMGQQPCQYECPDFFQLPVNGDKKKMKWVMTMNTVSYTHLTLPTINAV